MLGQLLPDSEKGVVIPKQSCLVKAAKRVRARVLSSQTQELNLKGQEPAIKTPPQSEDNLDPQLQPLSPPVEVDDTSSESINVDPNVLVPDLSHGPSSQHSDREIDQPLSDMPHYQILEGVSERGNPKLVDHRGYSYTFKRRRPNSKVDWICSVRNKSIRCHATVCQEDDQFHVGKNKHNHPPMPGIATYLSIKAKVNWLTSSLYSFRNFVVYLSPDSHI